MIDTLTAYKCSFRFLQRNNPLIGEQRNAIKDDKKPDYSFFEFLNDYTEYTKDIAVGESSHRAISLSQDNIDYSEQNDICKWHIIMSAGKQGQPVTVVKIHTKKRYNYGSDTAALYNHHVFFFIKNLIQLLLSSIDRMDRDVRAFSLKPQIKQSNLEVLNLRWN